MSFEVSDEFRASFFEECDELLEAMQDGFTRMVEGSDEPETIHTVFRAVHSIKGGAGAFGLSDLVCFAHEFETALDHVRAGRVASNSDLLMLFQQCGDHLADLVAAARAGGTADAKRAETLLGSLQSATGAATALSDAPPSEDEAPEFVPLALDLAPLPALNASDPVGWRLTFRAEPEMFTSGNEPLHLLRALDRFGTVTSRADLGDVPALGLLDPMMCNLTWVIDVETDAADDVIMDVFDFVLDCSEIDISPLRRADQTSDQPHPQSGAATDPVSADASQGEDVETNEQGPARAPDQPIAKPPAPPASAIAAQTIRVDFERVDKLINLVGELVIKEAMLSQAMDAIDAPRSNDIYQELDGLKQLASEIQEGVMAIRAQPIKPLFQRMARTIRDASAMTGKKVRLVMKGETAEIDKTVLERLVDPLNHMVRNSVDHGLETEQDRLDAGKPAEGMIELSAAHRSGRVVIEITDDGAGIDRAKVRQVAEDRGLIEPGAELTEAEIDALLFMPGFSSKDEVSELSGRGVGLDVVRNEISALGGRLSVTSRPGAGSTFSISLPLTLAVLEGMVVDVAGQTMVVPITAIKETLHASAAQVHLIGSNTRVLSIRDTLLPIADLGAVFGFRDETDDLGDRIFLVIETESDTRCALIVDALQDQRQVVIKSLETNYCRIDGVAAATILGDGRIALIVDPEGIAGGLCNAGPMALPSSHFDSLEGGTDVAI